jgi:hypothetical protein
MPGGLVLLRNALKAVSDQAQAADKSLREVPESAARATEAVRGAEEEAAAATERTFRSIRTFRAGATAAVVEVERSLESLTAGIRDSEGEIIDLRDLLRNGGDIAALLPNQQTTIAAIRDTQFGGYLDRYAELFIQKLLAGSTATAAQTLAFERNLYAKDIGAQDIIRRLTGSAGRAFDFNRFETDLKALVAAQQAMEKLARQTGTQARTGATSGTLGRTPSEQCGASTPLDLLRYTGALR